MLTSDDAFDLLRDDWDDLLDSSGQRTFFLRWSWARLWWRTYAPRNSRLRLIACRDHEGTLVGLAPLYWRRLSNAGIPLLREILFLGTGIFTETSHYLDIITRPGYERLVANTVAESLTQQCDWDRLRLLTTPDSSGLLPRLGEALATTGHLLSEPWDQGHSVDTTTSWEAFINSLGKSARTNVLRYMRRVFKVYEAIFTLVKTEAELEPAMDALIQLHQARWESRGEPGSFALPGFESFIREAARASLAEGRLRLWTLSLNGRIAAAMLAFFDNGVVYGFQQGFDPHFVKDAPGRVISALCIKDCIEDDRVNEFDFMGGNNQYKDSWSTSGRETVSFTLVRPGLRSRLFEVLEQLQSGGKAIVRMVAPARLRISVHRLLQRRHYSK